MLIFKTILWMFAMSPQLLFPDEIPISEEEVQAWLDNIGPLIDLPSKLQTGFAKIKQSHRSGLPENSL